MHFCFKSKQKSDRTIRDYNAVRRRVDRMRILKELMIAVQLFSVLAAFLYAGAVEAYHIPVFSKELIIAILGLGFLSFVLISFLQGLYSQKDPKP